MGSKTEAHLHWCYDRGQIDFDEPNAMLADDYLYKARESLEVASLLEENEFYDWSVTVSYYARYFALTSLLRRCGLIVENHACAISIFDYAFIGTGELDDKLLDSIKKGKRNRIEKQYGITRTVAKTAIKQRRNAIFFVNEITAFLEGITFDLINRIRETVERV